MTEDAMTETSVQVRPRTFDEAIGVLAENIANYEERPEQMLLARAIEKSLTDGDTLIGQGGCGVGKSFAALLPAIVSGETTVYATATKALQDQIGRKDLPFLAEHFGFTYAVLKGRKNYLCQQALIDLEDETMKGLLQARLDEGVDLAERHEFPDVTDAQWAQVTVSGDDCLGSQCPFKTTCFANEAKRRATLANVVVVNHALLVTDAVISQLTDGFVSMLPPYKNLIIDEAHEFEEYVTGALETQVKEGGLIQLLAEIRNLFFRVNFDADKELNAATRAIGEFFEWLPEGRIRRRDAFAAEEFFDGLLSSINALYQILVGPEFIEALPSLAEGATGHEIERLNRRRKLLARRADGYINSVKSAILDEDTVTVRFGEVYRLRGGQERKSLRVVPVVVSDWLRENLWSKVSPVMISATILVEGKADFIQRRLGIDNATVLDAGTPFDYQRQAMLYVPETDDVGDPSRKDHAHIRERNTTLMIKRLVEASEGRALVLFTSRKAMETAFGKLKGEFENLGYRTRRQGEATNLELMEWFKADTNGVLFATRSFFTGIDIQGESLSLVIIDKLPFPVPTEPVFEARCEEVERRGGSAFGELTIPAMTLPLQQAFGRLIRTKQDRGVVAILDPRIHSKGYGRSIVRSLPPTTLVRRADEVEGFFS